MNELSELNFTTEIPENIMDNSIWMKYKSFVDVNKKKRQLRNNILDINEEPPEIILDIGSYNLHNTEVRPRFAEDYTFLSYQWLNDLFGMEWSVVYKAMGAYELHPFGILGMTYFRESNIIGMLDMLNSLSRIAFIESNRPIEKVISDSNKLVYTSKDVMEMLNVKESTLRKYRDNNLLPYSKAGDKIFYTQEHLKEFLQRTDINNQYNYNI